MLFRSLFSTVSGAVKRNVWSATRFSEDIIMSEDQELAARLLLSGNLIAYRADSAVYHCNNYSLSTAFRRYFDSGWSMTYAPYLRISGTQRSLEFLNSQLGSIWNEPGLGARERVFAVLYLMAKLSGFRLGQFAPNLPAYVRSRVSYTRSIVAATGGRDPETRQVGDPSPAA